jgi:hypothetical protein
LPQNRFIGVQNAKLLQELLRFAQGVGLLQNDVAMYGMGAATNSTIA